MTRPSESGHWYTTEGVPMYEVKARNGTMRPTTLRDARQLNLVPGASTIIRCAAAPNLERWKREQTMLAALTLPRNAGEAERDWLARVEHDSQEQGRKAAERGTAIHAAIQGHFEGRAPDPDFWEHVKGARDALAAAYGPQDWRAERSFAHPLGYGGKCDLHTDEILVDVKSKEFTADNLPATYDEHDMQLAAYAAGLAIAPGPRAILYVSASVPGLCHLVTIDTERIIAGWGMFRGLLTYWQAKCGYKPTWGERHAA